VGAAAACAGPAGCGAHIVPPELSAADEPAVVVLTDYGRHSSLILPRDDGTAVEYAYGQLGWYALDRRVWWKTPFVTLLPNSGALGTRTLPAPEVGGLPPPEPALQHAYTLAVPREAVGRLLRRLDARFAAGTGPVIDNPGTGLLFVRDGRSYWLLNNCNTEVAGWLRELGCRVDGPSVWAKFSFTPAPAPAAWRREPAAP